MNGQVGLYLRYKNRADETVVAVHDEGLDAPIYKRFHIYNIDKNTHYYVSLSGQWMGNMHEAPLDILYEV